MDKLEKRFTFGWYGVGHDSPCTEFSFYNKDMTLVEGFENVRMISQSSGTISISWSADLDREERKRWKEVGPILQMWGQTEQDFIAAKQLITKFECGKSYLIELKKDGEFTLENFKPSYYKQGGTDFVLAPTVKPTCPIPPECECKSHVFQFRRIWRTNNKYWGWSKDKLWDLCLKDKEFGYRVELYYATDDLEVDTELYLDKHPSDPEFTIKREKDPWVWSKTTEKFYRLENNKIVEIVSCFDIAPVDCVEQSWDGIPWQPCEDADENIVTCGDAKRKRTRGIEIPARNNGKECEGPFEQEEDCNLTGCPQDCVPEVWDSDNVEHNWTECSKPCMEKNGTPGERTRTRGVEISAKNGGVPCKDSDLTETELCNTHPCPIDCVVSDWIKGDPLDEDGWSVCSKPCNDELTPLGTQTRTRTKLVLPEHGGAECPDLEESRTCNDIPCPIDCEPEAEWSEWTECSTPCHSGETNAQIGFRVRTRSIEVHAQHGGRECTQAQLRDTESCGQDPCPIDCVVNDWTPWSGCVLGGTQVDCMADLPSGSRPLSTRIRTVDTHPNSAGVKCPHLSEVRECIPESVADGMNPADKLDYSIIEDCPVDCIMGPWVWDVCRDDENEEVTCGAGNARKATRKIILQPKFGGLVCGDTEKTESCDPLLPECSTDVAGDEVLCVDLTFKGGLSRQEHLHKFVGTYEQSMDESEWKFGHPIWKHKSNAGYVIELFHPTTWVLKFGSVSTAAAATDSENSPHSPNIGTWRVSTNGADRYINSVTISNGACVDVDCEMNDWTAWDPVECPCGGGTQSRTRTIKTHPKYDGAPCGPERDLHECDYVSCEVDCSGDLCILGSGERQSIYRHRNDRADLVERSYIDGKYTRWDNDGIYWMKEANAVVIRYIPKGQSLYRRGQDWSSPQMSNLVELDKKSTRLDFDAWVIGWAAGAAILNLPDVYYYAKATSTICPPAGKVWHPMSEWNFLLNTKYPQSKEAYTSDTVQLAAAKGELVDCNVTFTEKVPCDLIDLGRAGEIDYDIVELTLDFDYDVEFIGNDGSFSSTGDFASWNTDGLATGPTQNDKCPYVGVTHPRTQVFNDYHQPCTPTCAQYGGGSKSTTFIKDHKNTHKSTPACFHDLWRAVAQGMGSGIPGYAQTKLVSKQDKYETAPIDSSTVCGTAYGIKPYASAGCGGLSNYWKYLSCSQAVGYVGWNNIPGYGAWCKGSWNTFLEIKLNGVWDLARIHAQFALGNGRNYARTALKTEVYGKPVTKIESGQASRDEIASEWFEIPAYHKNSFHDPEKPTSESHLAEPTMAKDIVAAEVTKIRFTGTGGYSGTGMQMQGRNNNGQFALQILRLEGRNPTGCPAGKVDCIKGNAYSKWSECRDENNEVVTCGAGSQTRTLNELVPAMFGGTPCTDMTQIQQCVLPECPSDCEGEWSGWGDCKNQRGTIVGCGEGKKFNTFVESKSAIGGGRTCTELFGAKHGDQKEQACGDKCGPITIDCGITYKHLGVLDDGIFTYTLNFTKAKHTLGKVSVILNPKGGAENFKITYEDTVVVNETTSAKKTVTFDLNGTSKIATIAVTSYSTLTEWEVQAVCPAPVDCVSHWGGFGDCLGDDKQPVTCGGGTKTRSRVIDVQPLGGTACGPETDSALCNEHPCPRDCEPESEFTYSGCQLGQSIVVAAGNNFSSGPWNVWRMHDRYSDSGFDAYADETPLTGYVDRLGGRNNPTPKLIRGSLYDAFWINEAAHLGGFAIHTDNTIYATDASWGHSFSSSNTVRAKYSPLWEGKIKSGGKYEWRRIGKWDPVDVVTSGTGSSRMGWRIPTGVTVALNGMVYVVDSATAFQTGGRLSNGDFEFGHMYGVMRRISIPNDPADVNRAVPVKERIIKIGFSSPDSIAVDTDHNIYILDSYKTSWGFKGLLKMTRKATGYEWDDPIHLWDYPGSSPAIDVAVDLNNILYVAGREGVYKLNNEGGGSWKIHAGSFSGVSVDGVGNVYLMPSSGAHPSILKPNGRGGYVSKVEELSCHGGVCKGPAEPLNGKSYGTNCCPWGKTSSFQPARIRVPLVDPEEEVSCGNQYGLVKTGTRGIKNQKVGAGKDCTGLTTVTECDGSDIQVCKQDCTGVWGEYGPCVDNAYQLLAGGCGTGYNWREYYVTQFAQGGGDECSKPDGFRETIDCEVADTCCDCGHPAKDSGEIVAIHEQLNAQNEPWLRAYGDTGMGPGVDYKYGTGMGGGLWSKKHTFKTDFVDWRDSEQSCTACDHEMWFNGNSLTPFSELFCPVTRGMSVTPESKEKYWFLDKFPVHECASSDQGDPFGSQAERNIRESTNLRLCADQTIGGDGFYGAWWAQGCTKYDNGEYYMHPCGIDKKGSWKSLTDDRTRKIDSFGNDENQPYQMRLTYELDRRINISRIEIEFEMDFRGYPDVTFGISWRGNNNGNGYTIAEGEEPVESRERFYGKMAADSSLKPGTGGYTPPTSAQMLQLMQKYNIMPGTTNYGTQLPFIPKSATSGQTLNEFVKWRVIAHGTGHDVNADHGKASYRVDAPCTNIADSYTIRNGYPTSCGGVPNSALNKPYGSIELGHGEGPGKFEMVGCGAEGGCTFETDDGSYDGTKYGHVGLKEVIDDLNPVSGRRATGWEAKAKTKFDKLGKTSDEDGVAPGLHDQVWKIDTTNWMHPEYGNENRWKQFIGTNKFEEPGGSGGKETTRNNGHKPFHTDRIEIVFWQNSAHDYVWKAGVKSIKIWGIESCINDSNRGHDWRQDHVAKYAGSSSYFRKLNQLPNPWAMPTKDCWPSLAVPHELSGGHSEEDIHDY